MNKKLLAIAAATFAVFLLLALALLPILHPKGAGRWILLGGLILLGAVAAVLVYFILAARARAGAARDDAVDAAMAATRARLGRAVRIGRIPAVLVLGPSGSAKTSIILESGLAPELLAGEARRDGLPVPTEVMNVFYAQGTVFVDAGGAQENPARWSRLLRHLRPQRLRAALARGAQAPRVAVLCFPCDELIRPGAAQSAVNAARTLRERLLEASRVLGVKLPLYVLFTRADRIPHFTEYVRSLSRAEAQEVFGATLSPQAPVAAALYVEREAQRVAGTVRELVQSLSLRRPELLGREADERVRVTAYEFPREMRKLSDVVVQFLVELTRPSHLGTSPFLRGFYFTGVRPVVVEEGAALAAAPPSAPQQVGGVLDATSVFDARMFQAQAAAAAAAASPRGTRRIPEWSFLRRLFPEVVLVDHAAMRATSGGARVDALRRAGLAAAAVIAFIAAVGFTTSYAGNRGLEQDVLAAERGVRAMDATTLAGASTDALQRLDALREAGARLRAYDQEHTPLHLRWGLYTGDAVLSSMRDLYFRAFSPMLWQSTRAALLASLRALPAAPDETMQYSPIYEALKAHLVTTSHPEASTADFLGPVLMRYWHPDGPPDPARAALARRQFEFFGSELPFGNPYNDTPDPQLVAQTQAFLQKFGDVQRLYAALVAEASDSTPGIQFARVAPGAAPVVRNDVAVPGAFTKAGWTYVQRRLRDVNKLFAREEWVVGPAMVPPQDRLRIAQQLRQEYVADYIRHWQAFLDGGAVAGFGGPEEASRTLLRLADPQSPLLQMLAIASVNTAVDTVVSAAFQPVHAVVPATVTDKFVVDANKPYVQALGGLQGALAQVAAAQGPARTNMLPQLASAAQQANAAVLQLSQAFSVAAPAAPAGQQVQRLLAAPVSAVTGLSAGMPVADLNGKGADFCRQIGRVLAKYPFNPGGPDASMDEVGQLFSPAGNAFSTFFNGGLQDVMVQQGPRYAAKLGATPQPSGAFVAFFNRASDISHTLYDTDGSGPTVAFVLRPQTSPDVPQVDVSIDGQTQTTTRTVAAAHTFEWDGARARDARITATIRGNTVTLQAPPGPWALFRLMQQADWQSQGGGRYTLRWRLPQGGALAADINFAKVSPVFMRDYLGGLRCVSEVAR